jgi:hypothetical protein
VYSLYTCCYNIYISLIYFMYRLLKRGQGGKLSTHGISVLGTVWTKKRLPCCAARAFYDCPAIISHRPRSQNISKEAQLNPEKDSRRKRPRSQVSLEKSSQNYKPLDKWAKPNLTPDVTLHPSQCLGKCIWRVCHVGKARTRENHLPNSGAKDSRQEQGGGRGDLRFDISH